MMTTFASLHIGLVDHAAHAAEMVAVTVRVNHRRNGPRAKLFIDQSSAPPRLSRAVVSGSINIHPVAPLMTVMLETSNPRTCHILSDSA